MENLHELNVNELTFNELSSINGGSGFWEDVAFGLGYVVGKLNHSLEHIEPQVQQRW
ncbi:MAG: bacteriocin [Flavobacterium sp.]